MIRRMVLVVSEVQRADPVGRVTATSTDGLKVIFEAPNAWLYEAKEGGAIVMDISFHRPAASKQKEQETVDYDKKFMRLLGANTEKRS